MNDRTLGHGTRGSRIAEGNTERMAWRLQERCGTARNEAKRQVVDFGA